MLLKSVVFTGSSCYEGLGVLAESWWGKLFTRWMWWTIGPVVAESYECCRAIFKGNTYGFLKWRTRHTKWTVNWKSRKTESQKFNWVSARVYFLESDIHQCSAQRYNKFWIRVQNRELLFLFVKYELEKKTSAMVQKILKQETVQKALQWFTIFEWKLSQFHAFLLSDDKFRFFFICSVIRWISESSIFKICTLLDYSKEQETFLKSWPILTIRNHF